MRFTLDKPPFQSRTGRGIVVAVLDSGVHADHPHIGGIQGGISLSGDSVDLVDRIGHGTAVAAAIREKAPGVELLAIKVFHRLLATNADVLARAIVWAADHGATIINSSLGTTNTGHAERLASAVEHATAKGAIIVSAYESNGASFLPGSLPGVIGVVSDPNLERDEIRLESRDVGTPIVHAAPFPRPIPGVPRERNLSGVSFAVANVSGFFARAAESAGGSASAALSLFREVRG